MGANTEPVNEKDLSEFKEQVKHHNAVFNRKMLKEVCYSACQNASMTLKGN